MRSSRIILAVVLCGTLSFSSGCAWMWEELHPHRLNKLNQGPPPPEARDFSLRSSDHSTRLVKLEGLPNGAVLPER
jgi:hypothetical protein